MAGLRALFLGSRLLAVLLVVVTALLVGSQLTQALMASPAEQVAPRGKGAGSVRLPSDLTGAASAEAVRVPLSPNVDTVLLSENFEGTWPPPGGNWQAIDNGDFAGEYYWAKRCGGRNSAGGAWAVGGGANGSGLACGSAYPNRAESWMLYGPLDLSQATTAQMTFDFWVNSECVGTNCATKLDRLWAVASADPVNAGFTGLWWAGNWFDDPSADPNGWVSGSLDMDGWAGEPQVWIAFGFESDGSVVFPRGAHVDNIVVRACVGCAATATPTATTRPPTARINTLTTDANCYRPGTQIGAFVNVGTTLGSQSVRVEVGLFSGDVGWSSAQQTFTAPGSRVIPLQVPADLSPGDYEVWVWLYDATSNALQEFRRLTGIRVDPTCGVTVTATPTATATVSATPTVDVTLCPEQTFHETKRIFIPPAPGRADIVFAFDASGSMADEIAVARSNAIAIMNNLAGLIPDVQFGVLDFLDYPTDPYGRAGDHQYLLRQAITANRTGVQNAINAITTGHGGDEPESYTRALYEAYADPAIGWRRDARRFVVMFGDSVAHDDDLNAGVPSPPYRAGLSWPTGYAPSFLDPGRDAQPGTGDDLDFQTVLNGMRTNNITLLFVTSGPAPVGPSLDGLTTYWQNWAARTGAGGSAVKLSNTADLPNVIQTLVTAASRRITRLSLVTDPPQFQSWITSVPAEYTNLDVPPGGLTVTFEVDIRPPAGTPIGATYTFAIRAVGDGAVYGGQGVTVRVPASCATATPTAPATATATPTATATATPTATSLVCPIPRPHVDPTCPGPNYVRNPYFEKFDLNRPRSWSEYSSTGRGIVSPNQAQEGFYSARFEGPMDRAADEQLYQVLDIPADITASSFWVEYRANSASGAGSPLPPTSGRDFFRAAIYDVTMTTELVRLWQFDCLSRCEPDDSSYNLTPADLDRIRGRTVVLVFWMHKETSTGWQNVVIIDGVHFTVCSPSPPCRIDRNKTASPNVVQPGGEVTVMLSLTGLDGACLPARKSADVMLVLDRSGSMAGQPFEDAKVAAKKFVDRMDLSTDQVGLASFSDSASLDQTLTQFAGLVRAAIDGLVAAGSTNIAEAITTAQGELTSGRHRTSNQPVIVLMSDGRPNVGGDPLVAAAAAKAAGTRIFTIGLGTDIDPDLMRSLASAPSDYFFAPDSSQLDAIYQQIAGAIGGAPATNIVIVDRLSPYVVLVPNSFTGSPLPEVSPDGRTLTWRIPRLGLETLVWTYRVKMTQTPGTWPTNDSATATFTDSRGQPGALTFPIPEVTVLQPQVKHPQIMCQDTPFDNGSVPSTATGDVWWESPDIWVRNQQDGVAAHQNPIAGQTNYVYVRVRNIGDTAVNDIKVHVYSTAGAANLRWPDDWLPEVGTATVASLPAGQQAVVAVPWTPPTQGHFCFLTRIEAPDDPITFDGWVPFDNNICQRNTQVIARTGPGTTVDVGNRGRGSGYGSVGINSRNVPATGGGTATVRFSDPKLFERWQQAGGTVSGGQVVSGTNTIRLNVRPSRSTLSGGQADPEAGEIEASIDRIPFEGEEVSSLIFEVETPAEVKPPTLQITQFIDGQPVGGNVLRPQILIPSYFPLVQRSSSP